MFFQFTILKVGERPRRGVRGSGSTGLIASSLVALSVD
jgi:hypothetical protein